MVVDFVGQRDLCLGLTDELQGTIRSFVTMDGQSKLLYAGDTLVNGRVAGVVCIERELRNRLNNC